ncbi:MAG: NUDIX hydrolase [Candidatus Paceibacterota bacterium]
MQEQIKKVELGKEVLDTIVGISIFRTNAEGKKEVLLVQGPSEKWYFPGGKIRNGESMKAGLRRELKEELGIDYAGSFGAYFVDSYEIKGKRFAIANVTALDSLPSEPKMQEGDAIKNFVWTEDPLSFDLTEQAREILKAKMSGIATLPKSRKIRNVSSDP